MKLVEASYIALHLLGWQCMCDVNTEWWGERPTLASQTHFHKMGKGWWTVYTEVTLLHLYSHLHTTFLGLRTTFGQQQKATKINALSHLDFLKNHMVSEHMVCSETSAISSSFKPSYIGSLVSCVTILLSVLLSIVLPLWSPTALLSYCFATLFSLFSNVLSISRWSIIRPANCILMRHKFICLLCYYYGPIFVILYSLYERQFGYASCHQVNVEDCHKKSVLWNFKSTDYCVFCQ